MMITPLQPWVGEKVGQSADFSDRSSLSRYQLQKLQQVVEYARANSRFYAAQFSAIPRLPRSFEEFATLPFTTSRDLQEDPNRFLCVHADDVSRIVTLPTSGTTGPSKRIFFSAADQELTTDFFRVGMSVLVRPGDRVMILFPGQRPGTIGDLLATALERLDSHPYKFGPPGLEEDALGFILEKNINVVVGAPVQIRRLAVCDRARHLLPAGQIRSVLTSSDVLTNKVLADLREIWGCEVFDHYGMTETGLGGGVECDAHTGYHLREADIYYEIIDPINRLPVPDGEMGEVVMTTMSHTAMPLIRYRTGDVSRFRVEPCPCGTHLRTLERVRGRITGSISFPSGRLTQTELDEALFTIKDLLDFSALLEDRLGHTILTLAVRPVDVLTPGLKRDLVDALKDIPVLRMEISAERLLVVVTEMEKPGPARTGYLFKRTIVDKRQREQR
jgi:phenylacetate-coenzyme A ligase PaaK-like adenylate-forming protein